MYINVAWDVNELNNIPKRINAKSNTLLKLAKGVRLDCGKVGRVYDFAVISSSETVGLWLLGDLLVCS